MNQFHGVTKLEFRQFSVASSPDHDTDLAQKLKIAEGGHVWMCPCVNGDVIVALESQEEFLGESKNIHTNHEMSRFLIVYIEELNKWRCEL